MLAGPLQAEPVTALDEAGEAWIAPDRDAPARPQACAAPLAATAGQTLPLDALPLDLKAWRGGSGRRYIVSVYALDAADDGYAGALLLAVERSKDGQRRIVGARETGTLALTGLNGSWLARMRAQGANEMHVHLLAADPAARRAVLADLAVG